MSAPASSSSGPPQQPPGPLVAVCTGHRCAALRRLDGEDDDVGASLREAVRASRGGVLVASPCVGACAHAPVAAVGLREVGRQQPDVVVWLGDLDRARRDALATWVVGSEAALVAHGSTRDPSRAPAWLRTLPEVLRHAVLGLPRGRTGHRWTPPRGARPAPPG